MSRVIRYRLVSAEQRHERMSHVPGCTDHILHMVLQQLHHLSVLQMKMLDRTCVSLLGSISTSMQA